ncbi:MAG: hypothetical protein M1358_13560 [Chloroflexi bacterium]|nr:hypothetical protein [Chloroflexota bacterium]
MNIALPLVSTSVTVIFAAFVFSQFASRRKSYQLLWGIGLLMFAIGTGSELAAGIGGWSDPVYKLWYLFGAILVAAYLGQGTIYLVVPRRLAHVVMVLLLLGSIYAAYAVLSAQTDMGQMLTTVGTASGQGMPKEIRLLTPFFNIFGTLALVGGAIYSAWVFWRHRILPHRVTANVLIAAGATFVALSGTIAKLGSAEFLYAGELVGSVVIFVGFLQSRRIATESETSKATTTPGRVAKGEA